MKKLKFPLKSPISEENLRLIVQGQQALLELEQSDIGRHFNLKDLAKTLPDLKLLLKCQEVRGVEVDHAILKTICEQHDSAPNHPRVGIEGGGPTGLLLAMTQYQQGADVFLFEKRSTQYERTQIVLRVKR